MESKAFFYFGDFSMAEENNKGYSSILSDEILSRDMKTRHYSVYAHKATTKDILDKLESQISEKVKGDDVQAIFFGVGINDSGYSLEGKIEVPLREYTENVRRIIRLAKEHTDNVIITGLTRINEELPQPYEGFEITYTNARIEVYDDRLRHTSENSGALYVSISNIIKPFNLSKGIYVNPEGHKAISEEIMQRAGHLFLAKR